MTTVALICLSVLVVFVLALLIALLWAVLCTLRALCDVSLKLPVDPDGGC